MFDDAVEFMFNKLGMPRSQALKVLSEALARPGLSVEVKLYVSVEPAYSPDYEERITFRASI